MRKNLQIFLLLIFIISSCYYESSQIEINKILDVSSGTRIKKLCHIDLLGFNVKGEYFDLYEFKFKGEVKIRTSIDIKKWKNINLNDKVVIKQWSKCPLDSIIFPEIELVFSNEKNIDKRCVNFFRKEINNSNNFYMYIYVDEFEQYFFLFNPNKRILYYIEKKGF